MKQIISHENCEHERINVSSNGKIKKKKNQRQIGRAAYINFFNHYFLLNN